MMKGGWNLYHKRQDLLIRNFEKFVSNTQCLFGDTFFSSKPAFKQQNAVSTLFLLFGWQKKQFLESCFWLLNASIGEAGIPSFHGKAKSRLAFNFQWPIHFTKLPIAFFLTSLISCTPTTHIWISLCKFILLLRTSTNWWKNGIIEWNYWEMEEEETILVLRDGDGCRNHWRRLRTNGRDT